MKLGLSLCQLAQGFFSLFFMGLLLLLNLAKAETLETKTTFQWLFEIRKVFKRFGEGF
jgi:hypothetical protein